MPPMAASAPRVLVVEDDEVLAEALEIALKSEGFEIAVEHTAADAERTAAVFLPDLAIVDVRLPSGSEGIGLAKRLRLSGDLALLFLTAADAVDDRVAGFEAGADDYVAKPFAMAELLLRVRALLRRAGKIRSSVLQIGNLVIDESAHLVVFSDAVIDLTPTEFALLTVFVKQPGQVLSKGQLLEHVWGSDVYDANVVEVHISSLRRKLEQHAPRLIHTVRGIGYVLRQ
jgi:two-component system OmpR family response regulator